MYNRKEVLNKILNMEEPVEKFYELLNKFEWDSEKELVVLTEQHILNILQKYLNNDINEFDIDNWANTIECRDDVGFARTNKDLIREILHELANPYLTVPLTKKRAIELCDNLIKGE